MELSKEQAEFLNIIKRLKSISDTKVTNTNIQIRLSLGRTFINDLKSKGSGRVTPELIQRLKEAFPNELMTDEERAAMGSEAEKELKVENYDLRKANNELRKEISELRKIISELQHEKRK